MKFSTAAILALASGISAMPWSSSHSAKQQTVSEDITLHIEVSKTPANHKLVDPSKLDICWLICGFEEIQCPEGWYPSKQGECWTCCRSAGGEL